jgi:hypothetical protein
MRGAFNQGDARGHDEVGVTPGPVAPGDRPLQAQRHQENSGDRAFFFG